MLFVLNELRDTKVGEKISDEKLFMYSLYMLVLVAIQFLSTVLNNWQNLIVSRLSVRVRSAVTSLLLKKVFKFSVLNPNEYSEGKILNYVTVDANKFEFCCFQTITLVTSSWNLILGILSVYFIAGSAILPVIGVASAGGLIMFLIQKSVYKFREDLMNCKDKR